MHEKKMKITEYIKKTRNTLQEKKETLFYNRINVFVKDPLPEGVFLQNVLEKVESIVPDHLVTNVDVLYVGHFKFMDKYDLNAMYKDQALYISNDQDDEEDMIDDIVHELAHSVEEKNWSEIYGDEKLEKEFLGKRKKLYQLLSAHDYSVELKQFMNPEYDLGFDEKIYKEIGYDKLEHFSMNLFISPYGITSLKEYFGNGFEHFFIGDKKSLTKVSPVLYNKIAALVEEGENLDETW